MYAFKTLCNVFHNNVIINEIFIRHMMVPIYQNNQKLDVYDRKLEGNYLIVIFDKYQRVMMNS